MNNGELEPHRRRASKSHKKSWLFRPVTIRIAFVVLKWIVLVVRLFWF